MKPKIIVLGEKPQGVSWLKMLLASNLFDIIGGVPRKNFKNAWWGLDDFETLLKHHGIPILNREDLKTIDYDIIWSLMYGYIIEPHLINKAAWFGLNLHESPLPKYRGCNGFSHAIINNENTYGTTLQILGEELDSGGIIDQEIYPINKDETAKELYERTKIISDLIFKRNLEKIATKSISFKSIDISKEKIRIRTSLKDCKDISSHPINRIRNIVRALDFLPFEPAYSIEKDTKFYYFINNSWGRLYHENQIAINLEENQRDIIKMQENEYKKIYPLFIPEFSWER